MALPIRFGLFEVDLASGELRKQGVRIKLQEQPFQALLALLERPGEVVTRDELQKRIWPADVTVDFDRGLNKAINRLREALGDDADDPRFIETLPQRGYRFLAPLETPLETTLETASAKPSRRPWMIAAGGLIAVPILYTAYRLGPWSGITSSPKIESIAVLPLENLSGNPEQEYFSDGLTDELIGEIARIGSLRVISRTSVMRYKRGQRKSLPDIARELNVDALIEGTVMQVGERVRITAQLIRAADDRHLWAGKYERKLTDILAIQSEVARAVAGQIRIQLTPEEQANLSRTRQVNPAAYDAFLKGNFFLYRGIRGTHQSIEFFRQAIALDPLQAEAHAGLAQALGYAAIFGFRPSSEIYPEARVAALKALEIDPSNAAGHNALAEVKKGYDWDLPAALLEYDRALKLNPSHLLTRIWRAECLARMQRFDEALDETSRALSLDPVSTAVHTSRAMILWRARRYTEAIASSDQALNLEPNMVNALWWKGLAQAGQKDFRQATATMAKLIAWNDQPLFASALGYVAALAGDRPKAYAILEGLGKAARQRYVSPVDFAIVHAGLADADSTFGWLEKACVQKAMRVHELVTPYFDRFRADPRYADLQRRIGL